MSQSAGDDADVVRVASRHAAGASARTGVNTKNRLFGQLGNLSGDGLQSEVVAVLTVVRVRGHCPGGLGSWLE